MSKVAELRAWGLSELKAAACDPLSGLDPETVLLDVDLLLIKTLGLSDRVQLILEDKCETTVEQQSVFASFIERRKKSEPIAYILGVKEFRSLEFEVSPSVLIPRPETEIIVEVALTHFANKPRKFSIVDIGVGSGAICLSLLNELRQLYGEDYLKQGRVVACDLSPQALEVAARNAKKFKLQNYLQFVQSDLLAKVDLENDAELKLFLSNPPYVSRNESLLRNVIGYEPEHALFAEDEGLEIIGRILESLAAELRKGAVLVMEIGANQQARVDSALLNLGLSHWKWHRDLAGVRRVVEV